MKYGGITNFNSVIENLKQNAVPLSIFEMTMEDYREFLVQRRKLMAEKIRIYYEMI